MKYYLLTFRIMDNGHEHYDHITTEAKSEEEARSKGLTQEHEMFEAEDEDNLTMFDFGDGETCATLRDVKQISKGQMKALDDTGVAHFYPLNG